MRTPHPATLAQNRAAVELALPRLQEIAALRREGRTLQYIGDIYGVTRQCISRLAKAAKREGLL